MNLEFFCNWCFRNYLDPKCTLTGAGRKKINVQKMEGKERAAPIFALLQKKECHSHIAPSDKKEWHSSFAPNFGSGAQEWRSKEWRSLTHWYKWKLINGFMAFFAMSVTGSNFSASCINSSILDSNSASPWKKL